MKNKNNTAPPETFAKPVEYEAYDANGKPAGTAMVYESRAWRDNQRQQQRQETRKADY